MPQPRPNPDREAASPALGARLRELRKQRGVSARALSAQLGISPSAVSQIERGVIQPSVSRLIAIADALDIPLALLFEDRGTPNTDTEQAPTPDFTMVRAEQAATVTLDSGVTFRRLSPVRLPSIDFFESVYPPGSAANDRTDFFRHEGNEIGTVLAGELTIDFEDERIVLRPGDSVSFPCSRPHRIHNAGGEDAVAHWLIQHPGR